MKRCQCGCYVPDRCHACGREIGDPRNESAELAMVRAENAGLKKALAGLQAVVNGRRTGPVEWLREEFRVSGWDERAALVLLVAALVYALATVAGQIAGGV